MHGCVPLLGPLGQRSSAELAHALRHGVIGFVAGVGCSGAIFHLAGQRGHLLIQLRMAGVTRHQIRGVFT